MQEPLSLPAELTIYSVGEWAPRLRAHLTGRVDDGCLDSLRVEADAVREVDAAGAKAWMVKPFNPPQLLDAVSKLILP